MKETSAFFPPADTNHTFSGNTHEPVLLHSTGLSNLYRICKDGKYYIFKTSKSNKEHIRQLLKREYEIGKECSHPNIVSMVSYKEIPSVGDGIIMEYIEGRTLTEFLKESPTLSLRCKIFSELLSAIIYIHQKGLVHNDIKPDNILISTNGNSLKLLDFGLSDSDAHYALHTLGCSSRYASPELLKHEERVDVRSDVYSIGCVMREIFGRKYSHISRRCLKVDKESRYRDVSELANTWNKRNNLRIASIFFFLLLGLLLLITFIKVKQERIATTTYKYESYIIKQKQKEKEADRKQAQQEISVPSKIKSFYFIVADSVKNASHQEEAQQVMMSFYQSLAQYQEEMLAKTNSPQEKDIFLKIYTEEMNKYNDILWDIIKEKPSVYSHE